MGYVRLLQCDACGQRVQLGAEAESGPHGWLVLETLVDQRRPYDAVPAVHAYVCSLECLRTLADNLIERRDSGDLPSRSVADYLMRAASVGKQHEDWREGRNAYL